MSHRFGAVHRRMAPSKPFTFDAVLFALPVYRSSAFTIPALRPVVIDPCLSDEALGFRDCLFRLSRKPNDERTKRHDVSFPQHPDAVTVFVNSGRLIHIRQDLRRSGFDAEENTAASAFGHQIQRLFIGVTTPEI